MAKNIADIDMPSQSATVVDRHQVAHKAIAQEPGRNSVNLSGSTGNLSRVLTGKIVPGEGLISRIVANTGVSKEWLVSGSNVPFPKDNAKKAAQGRPDLRY